MYKRIMRDARRLIANRRPDEEELPVKARVLEPAQDEYFVPPEDWNISESAKQILGVWPYTKAKTEDEK